MFRIGESKFEKALKNALRQQGLQITERPDEHTLLLTNGRSQLDFDIEEVREDFEKNGDKKSVVIFAENSAYELALEDRLNSFINAQSFLRLIVMNENEIQPHMVSADFAGQLKKTVCYTGEGSDVYTLDRKYLRKWGVPAEVLFSVADRNMGRLLGNTSYTFSEIGNGIKVMEFETKDDPLVVSMMLCNDFRELVSSKLGSRFMVAAPSRQSMIAIQEISNKLLEGLGKAILRDYNWADEPLSTDIFYYTPTGVTVAGRFR